MDRRPHRTSRAAVRLVVAGLVVSSMLLVTNGAAVAGCVFDLAPPAADGRVRELPSGPLVGNNIYNFSGAEQTALFNMAPGDPKHSFEVTYKNKSTKTRTITVGLHSLEEQDESFVIKVFKGDKNISHLFFDGEGKKFRRTPPKTKTPPLRVQVRMKGSASEFDLVEVNLRGRYGKQFPACGDNVQVQAGFPV